MADSYLAFAPIFVGPGTKTGVPVLTDNPREVGADRVAYTLAAFRRFGGPAVVVDFGTSTNFDVVSEKGEFVGEMRHPGLGGEPRVADRPAAPGRARGAPVGDRHEHGRVHPVGARVRHRGHGRRGTVRRIRVEIGEATTVATGGLAPVVIPHCQTIEHHEPWLTLEGLRLVHERNLEPADG